MREIMQPTIRNTRLNPGGNNETRTTIFESFCGITICIVDFVLRDRHNATGIRRDKSPCSGRRREASHVRPNSRARKDSKPTESSAAVNFRIDLGIAASARLALIN